MNQRIREYGIRSSGDNRNFILEKHYTAIDQETHEEKPAVINLAYFNKIDGAVTRLAELCANEKESLKDWLEEYKAIVAEVKRLLS